MFKKAALTARLPQPDALQRLEKQRLQMLQFTPGSRETYDGQDKLKVDLDLYYGRHPVDFDGCEPTFYAGQVDGVSVFTIYICDDEPTWLVEMLDLQENQIPGHGESVYVVASTLSGERVEVILAMYDGDFHTWNCEVGSPMNDQQLATLLQFVCI